MTQRKEHSWNEWDYKNRRTPVWVMMLTSASCCRHLQQDSACSFSVRQDSDISTQRTAPVYVIDIKISSSLDDVMSSTREDVIRRRHMLLRSADSSLNHEWSKTDYWSHVLMLVLTQLVCDRPKGMIKFTGIFYCSQQKKDRKKLAYSRIEFASLSLTAKMTCGKWSIGRLRDGMCRVVTANGGRGV
jgi:hypothetical protein